MALSFENAQHPKPDRAAEIALWQQRAVETVRLSAEVARHGKEFSTAGVPPLDAIHLACADIGMADVLLTCDDELTARARRLGLRVRVMNPVEYWQEVLSNG